MSDNQVRLHREAVEAWNRSMLDQVLPISRRRRLWSWLRRRPIRRLTLREQQALLNEHLAEHWRALRDDQ